MTHIFVFGSNLAGRHGAGSALEAKRMHGAIQFQGVGLQGNSYAIPTKDYQLNQLPLKSIRKHVDTFMTFARVNPHYTFNVVAIGCGLAGYKAADIAPMFYNAPPNVNLPGEFTTYLERAAQQNLCPCCKRPL